MGSSSKIPDLYKQFITNQGGAGTATEIAPKISAAFKFEKVLGQLLEELGEVGLRNSDGCIILGSGSGFLSGALKTGKPSDLDIVVPQAIYDKLRQRWGAMDVQTGPYDGEVVRAGERGVIDITSSWPTIIPYADLLANSVQHGVAGIRIIQPELLRDLKKETARPKDSAHIRELDESLERWSITHPFDSAPICS
ncbi:MAG: hypothetical protein KDI13_10580 [Alphaproteobacteria bacterium]|nr:hypothetical protein [Alphaproteobacteria bacterium]